MTNKLPEAEFFYGVSANCPLLKLNLCIDRLRLRPGVAPRQHQRSVEDQTGLEPAERAGPFRGDQVSDPAESRGLPVPIA